MMVSNRNLLFQGFIFRFHVSFPGCIEALQNETILDQHFRKPLRVVLMRLKFFATICCLSIKPLAVVPAGYMKLDFFSRLFTIYTTENQRLVHLKMMVYLQPMKGSFYMYIYIYIHIYIYIFGMGKPPEKNHPFSLLANWNLLDFLGPPPPFSGEPAGFVFHPKLPNPDDTWSWI